MLLKLSSDLYKRCVSEDKTEETLFKRHPSRILVPKVKWVRFNDISYRAISQS